MTHKRKVKDPQRVSNRERMILQLQNELSRPEPLHPLYRLGKTQCRFLLAVEELGSNAYLSQILPVFRNKYHEQKNIGQLSGIAKQLVKLGLISGAHGGSPTGMGRPVVVFKLTELADIVFRHMLEISTMSQSSPSAD